MRLQKAGLIGFTKSVAREVAARGVRVNAIAPGFIESDMTDAIPEKMKRCYDCSSTNETYWSSRRSGRSCSILG